MRAPASDTSPDVLVVNFDGLSGVGALLSGPGWLLGVLIWNDAQTFGGFVDIFDGTDTKGERLGRLYLPATQHVALNLPRPGWPFETGVTVNVNTGPLSGAALIARNHR